MSWNHWVQVSEYDAKTAVLYRFPASMVATTEMCDGRAYIETLMKTCRNCNDDLGRVLYDRLLDADGDLVTAEARYHRKCSFLFHKHSERNDDRSHSEVDTSVLKTFAMLDRKNIWNTVTLMELYEQNGGNTLSRWTLLEKVEGQFGEDRSFHYRGCNACRLKGQYCRRVRYCAHRIWRWSNPQETW